MLKREQLTKQIWEGWRVMDFIAKLETPFYYTSKMTTRKEIKKWCMDNQPYYKKYIPEVVEYFCRKSGVK
jgi:hypothetical protein